MNKKLLLFFFLYTLFSLYAGLWSELAGRIKFNQWDIFGPKGRVTNHNLYLNLYLVGILLVLIFHISDKIKRNLKSNKNV
jgi:hypothetical protein